MEKIIETKICKHCNSNFEITDKDIEFYEKVSPIFAGKKYNIPAPTLCPDCREQRRLSFRNERKLYKRKCDLSGKEIISIYSPNKTNKVYEHTQWWSDNWNSQDYGFDFDFNKSFFEQFKQLLNQIPRSSITIYNSENTNYCNHLMDSKNCYFLFSGANNEDCMFGRNIRRCTSSIDNLQLVDSEKCSNISIGSNNYNCHYGFHIFNCINSRFLWFCEGCSDCFLCTNIKNKKYCYKNISYSKNEYEEIIKNINNYPINKLNDIYNDFIKSSIHKSNNMMNNENQCSSDFIRNSKDVLSSYNISSCNNLKYCLEVEYSQDLYDISIGVKGNTLVYEGLAIGKDSNNSIIISTSTDNSYVYYSDFCFSSSNLFGCIGLCNKSYCILNKQYTREEYEKIVPKIIEHMQKSGEWGEFFPSSISLFGYNETVAMEYYPLTKEEAIKKGFNWSDYESPFPKVQKIIPANKLPDDIKNIPDDILNRAIECETTKKSFRIIKPELDFYRKHNLPIPRRHPDQRHLDRMNLRNPRKLFDRKCDKCGINMKTSYSPERGEVVYCEECYKREIY